MRRLETLLAILVTALASVLLIAAISGSEGPHGEPAKASSPAPLAALRPILTGPPGTDTRPLAATVEGELQAAPGAISVVEDPLGSGTPVFEMTVDDGDVYPITPTEDPRAQALTPPVIEPGDEIWLKTRFMLPEDFPAVPGWLSLISIYGPPFASSSPWQIGVDGEELRWQRNADYGYDVPWRAPLERERWITILLHERFATDGWVEMWVDGGRITFFSPSSYNPSGHPSTDRLEMATMDASNDGGPNSAKIMQYRQAGMFETATVYFGALAIGATRASVGG